MWPATHGEITLQCTRICEPTCVKTWTFDCEVKSCQRTEKRLAETCLSVEYMLTNRFICLCERLNTRLDR